MNREQRREVAKKIAQLEKSNKNNISEDFESEINSLIRNASLEDLFEIDDIIMKKYLTN